MFKTSLRALIIVLVGTFAVAPAYAAMALEYATDCSSGDGE